MEANKDKTPDEQALAGAIAGDVANVSDPAVKSDPTKEKIPAENIIQMLTNSTLREEVMPLLKDVLDKISNIEGLDEAISNLLKEKQNTQLTQALQKLQDRLRSIYIATYKTGGKRRKTNKRKNYKKRRSTKHR